MGQSPRHILQSVATNLQGLGAVTILLLVTNSKLTFSVYILRSNCPSAWLTCSSNGARIELLSIREFRMFGQGRPKFWASYR